jgi:hypothetical protein
VPIIVAASDPASSTSTIRIFYDSDNSVNGNEATIGSIPVSGTGTTWNTTGRLPGVYYVGAQLINGFDPPLVSYSAGPVTLVTPGSTGSGLPLSSTMASVLRRSSPAGATRRLHQLPNRSR